MWQTMFNKCGKYLCIGSEISIFIRFEEVKKIILQTMNF